MITDVDQLKTIDALNKLIDFKEGELKRLQFEIQSLKTSLELIQSSTISISVSNDSSFVSHAGRSKISLSDLE